MSSLSISTVIPAFNCEATVGRAIESVLNQSQPPDEIVVVDDGSTDDTSTVVQSFGGRVRYVSQENAGPSAARNRGIELAVGDWVAFLDADDVWYPQKLQRQTELIEQSSELGVVFCNWVIKDLSGCSRGHGFDLFAGQLNSEMVSLKQTGPELVTIEGDVFSALLAEYFLHTNTALVRTDYLQKNRFDPNYSWGEDWLLFLDLASEGARFGFVDQVLAEYQAHPNSICNRATLKTVTHRYEIAKLPLQRYGTLSTTLRRRLYPRISESARILGIRTWDELKLQGQARRIWREAAFLRPGVPDLALLAQSLTPALILDSCRRIKHRLQGANEAG